MRYFEDPFSCGSDLSVFWTPGNSLKCHEMCETDFKIQRQLGKLVVHMQDVFSQ